MLAWSHSKQAKHKEVGRLTFVEFPGVAEASGAQDARGLLPAPPVVGQALGLRAPGAQRVLLEPIGVVEARRVPTPFFPFQHRVFHTAQSRSSPCPSPAIIPRSARHFQTIY